MTLIPIIEKTQICLVHCGKEVCKCNPSRLINEVLDIISSKDLEDDIKEIVDNNFDDLI